MLGQPPSRSGKGAVLIVRSRAQPEQPWLRMSALSEAELWARLLAAGDDRPWLVEPTEHPQQVRFRYDRALSVVVDVVAVPGIRMKSLVSIASVHEPALHCPASRRRSRELRRKIAALARATVD